MTDFNFSEMFDLGEDKTEYRRLTKEHGLFRIFWWSGYIASNTRGLTLLAQQAFTDVSHLLRSSHLELLAKILDDPESSDNDRYVALEMLKNAVISAAGEFPMCQDTGTAIVMGKKGQQVWTGADDEASPGAWHFQRLHPKQPALFAERPLVHVRRKKHGLQPAGPDRAVCGPGRYL